MSKCSWNGVWNRVWKQKVRDVREGIESVGNVVERILNISHWSRRTTQNESSRWSAIALLIYFHQGSRNGI